MHQAYRQPLLLHSHKSQGKNCLNITRFSNDTFHFQTHPNPLNQMWVSECQPLGQYYVGTETINISNTYNITNRGVDAISFGGTFSNNERGTKNWGTWQSMCRENIKGREDNSEESSMDCDKERLQISHLLVHVTPSISHPPDFLILIPNQMYIKFSITTLCFYSSIIFRFQVKQQQFYLTYFIGNHHTNQSNYPDSL